MSVSASPPVVSVVMAAYNGAALIRETLESLAFQTFPHWEALVVDDGSTDDTRQVVAAWPDTRVRLIALAQNGGPVRARNRAAAEARGRYLAGLDQDDLCRPDRFARQVAYLDAHPEVALLGTQAEGLCEGAVGPLNYAAVTTPALIAWLTRIENPLVWSTVMVRADAARALDPFTRPDILYAEDFDLYHRIQPYGQIARLDDPLLLYRQHSGGASRRFTDTMRASAARVLTQVHESVLGEDAAEVAHLLVRHVMGGEPVADRAILLTLGRAIATVQHDHLARHDVDATSLRLIRWETAQRWSRIGRAGLRAGTLTLADVLAARPDHLGLGYAGPADLLWSSAIGGARRVQAR